MQTVENILTGRPTLDTRWKSTWDLLFLVPACCVQGTTLYRCLCGVCVLALSSWKHELSGGEETQAWNSFSFSLVHGVSLCFPCLEPNWGALSPQGDDITVCYVFLIRKATSTLIVTTVRGVSFLLVPTLPMEKFHRTGCCSWRLMGISCDLHVSTIQI